MKKGDGWKRLRLTVKMTVITTFCLHGTHEKFRTQVIVHKVYIVMSNAGWITNENVLTLFIVQAHCPHPNPASSNAF